jgi:hypothetical protein
MQIFDGRDIRVVAKLFEAAKEDLVITFTGRAANPPVEKGFGENYLIKRQISAIHFISKDNHWWQTPEPAAAVSELHRLGLVGGNRKVTLYGSSMGGYAALMLSRMIKPRRIVLFSPQYSIDPARVPFEKRWRTYAAKLQFDHDDMAAGIDHDAEIQVVYDPFFEPDRQHVALIEKLRPVNHVPIRFAGHNTARTLEELGIITRVIDDLLFGAFDVREFLRLYRRSRAGSSLFWYGLSQVLARNGHRGGATLAACMAAKILLVGGRMKDPVLRRDILRSALSMACEAGMPALAKVWFAELQSIESSSARMAYASALVARAEEDWKQVDKKLGSLAGGKASEPAHVALKIEAMGRLLEPADSLAFLDGLPSGLKRSPAVLLAQGRILKDAKRWTQAIDVLKQYTRHDRLDPVARTLSARCHIELGLLEPAMKQISPVLHYHVANGRLADEIADLMEKGRGKKHAQKVRGRHKRYARLLATLLEAVDRVPWHEKTNAAMSLRDLLQSRQARPSALDEVGAL